MADNSEHKDATDKAGASWFKKWAQHFLDQLVTAAPGITRNVAGTFQELGPSSDDQQFQSWVDQMQKDGKIDEATATMLKNQVHDLPKLSGIISLILRIQVITTQIQNTLEVYGQEDQYKLLAQIQPHPADVSALIQSMIIDPSRASENRKQMRHLGYNDTQIDNLILARYQTVDERTIQDLYMRGEIGKNKMYERMRELGYTDTRIGEITQTWELIPPATDLVRFAYRALFTEETRRKWPWMFEMPTGFPEWMKKHGYSADWSEMYWAAHWTQPGLQQTFEMLHRGEIKLDDVLYALEARGFSSYWQEKLATISHRLYTRVDTRRMHELGVMNENDVFDEYKRMGYDTERARNMTTFTVRFNAKGESDLTRATILGAFEMGTIDREEAKDLLKAQDYSDATAEFYLTYTEAQEDQKHRQLQIDNIQERYMQRRITRLQASQQLAALDMDATTVDLTLDNWDLQRWKYERIPSLHDLTDFMRKDIISEHRFRQYMLQHGYDTETINYYIENIRNPAFDPGRLPTKADLVKFLQAGIIGWDKYRETLSLHGYNEGYINYYVALVSQQMKGE